MAASSVLQEHSELRARPASGGRPSRGHGSAAPVLDGPSATAAFLARATGSIHPVRAFAAGIVVAYAAVAGLSILLGLLVTRVLITNGPVARGDEALVRFLSHHRSGRPDRGIPDRLDHRRRRDAADPRGRIRSARCGLQAMAPCGVPHLRSRSRVGRLPDDDARRSPAPAEGLAARKPPGERQLSVRPHRGRDRRLLRPRPAPQLAGRRPAGAHRNLGVSPPRFPSTSRSRGCTGGCTTRSTSPAASSSGWQRSSRW